MSWRETGFAGPAASLLAAAVLLAACGFRPLFGPTAAGSAELAATAIEPIADRVGQQLRNRLLDLMTPAGRPANPRYSLSIVVRESVQRLAVRESKFATRANLRFTATFDLVDRSTGASLFSGVSVAIASFNILSSEFGTLMAEKNARQRGVRQIAEDIRGRVAAFFTQRRTAGAGAGR